MFVICVCSLGHSCPIYENNDSLDEWQISQNPKRFKNYLRGVEFRLRFHCNKSNLTHEYDKQIYIIYFATNIHFYTFIH